MASKSANTTGPRDVDRYIAAVADKPSRDALTRLRALIKKTAPEATEKISYQIPMFYYQNRGLVSYAAFSAHCTLFVQSKAIAGRIHSRTRWKGTPSSIHFTPGDPLPASVVREVVRARMRENKERAEKKKSSGYAHKRTPAARKTP